MDVHAAIEGTFLAGIALGAEFVPGPDAVPVGERWLIPVDDAGERVEAEVTSCAPGVGATFGVVMSGPSSRSVVGVCGTDTCDVWVVGVSNAAGLCIREPKP